MRAGFGGGCHWCTEAVFQALRGVERVEQGFIRSAPPDDDWSEAVIVHFDPDVISLDTLIEVHLRTHSSTRGHRMRRKYRSAVYVTDDRQRKASLDILQRLQPDFEADLITRVLTLEGFRPSDPRYRNYYRNNPDGPFCQRFIDPKLERIRHEFTDHALPMRL